MGHLRPGRRPARGEPEHSAHHARPRDLDRRPGPRPRSAPSIDAASVEHLRQVLEERRTARAAEQQRRAVADTPPDDGHVWLDTATVAVMVGLTRQWATRRAREGRIPATWHGGRWWVRREHAEQLAAAKNYTQGK